MSICSRLLGTLAFKSLRRTLILEKPHTDIVAVLHEGTKGTMLGVATVSTEDLSVFRSPNDDPKLIAKSQAYIDELWDEQKRHQDGWQDQDDPDGVFRMHEANMVKLERIKRQLSRLDEYVTQSGGKRLGFG